MRVLAIDYGLKRTGLAISDVLKITVTGLPTIPSQEIWRTLSDLLQTYPIETIVIGLPKTLQNTDTDMTKPVQELYEKIKQKYPNQKVILWDERLTSVLAQKTLRAAGLSKKKRQDKKVIDQMSATLILQSYLQSL
ncbi:MAG: Holliday junction resolvase RuvX [Bacteroidia bacterium]|nr:Holliday junction resolvase RuvX [Bacteroidia bacterium]MDW8300902.1 Holliday junction resolvase RuvX [Bacteroidia bacterium]